MKEKFTTIDLFAILRELRERVLGMRVANVYDIDQKTYLIKLARPDEKVMLLLESGCRMHATEFDLPKNMQPSGFSMKLRKHLRTRRVTMLSQVGVDRVVDMQFGSNEAAYHLIIELYDRGNIILTDHAGTILALLRTRTDTDKDVRFAVRERFSRDTAKMEQPPPSLEGVSEVIKGAKVGDQLKHALNPHFVYGSALLSHCLIGAGFSDTVKVGTGFDLENDGPRLMIALEEAHSLFHRIRDEPGKGYIIQKRQAQPQVDSASKNGEAVDVFTNVEYHPLLFRQHEGVPHVEMESFNKAVDEFYSMRSSQKQDLKALQVQKSAVKKLDNIRRDHEKRINSLQKSQEEDMYKAQLIELNVDLVEGACVVIRSAVANAMDWGDIELLVKDAQAREDPVAMAIHALKLKTNEITLLLRDPAEEWGSDSDSDETDTSAAAATAKKATKKAIKVDIDLSLTAFSNARRYYDHKKQAAKKEKKTIDASKMALKSAERKTKQTLKEASTVAKILKARKTHWFEKFYWFISSENYLVIGGRDQQQNELVVKKYLNDGDLYVHADLHGATSVIIKNPSGLPVPPKTLTEAGYMAVCYSSAWEARIITSAWWVYNHQVSKTAPTGEYLTTGSFMIRGKKNFLPPCQLILGFGFLFRVEESCIPNHLHERKPKPSDDDESSMLSDVATELSVEEEVDELEQEVDEAEKMLDQDQSGSESHSTDDHDEFPDTSITVAHVAGETYELQRGTSVSSSIPDDSEPPGDLDSAKEDKRHQHISAKQRRELRKQKQTGRQDDSTKNLQPSEKVLQKKSKRSQPIPPPQLQTKRGQKAKQKRIRDRYGDQDEEERELKLAILGSSRAAKEQKRSKKGGGKGKKKSFDVVQSSNPKQKYHQQRDKGEKSTSSTVVDKQHKQKAPLLVTVPETADNPLLHVQPQSLPTHQNQESELHVCEDDKEQGATLDDAVDDKETEPAGGVRTSEGDRPMQEHLEGEEAELSVTADGSKLEDNHWSPPDTEQQEATPDPRVESDDEEKKALLIEENIQLLEESEREQLSVLDSFTGCPIADDILLYAIPVCGPYSAMQSYKYKAKLVPGINRRGKAAKAALFRFIQSKETSQREKDLLKSVKDNDLSRYIPGKVKLSLPQNYKAQHR